MFGASPPYVPGQAIIPSKINFIMMKKYIFKRQNIIIGYFVIMMILLTSCADVLSIDTCRAGTQYGFLGGVWHGIVAPFSFIASVFFDSIAMYAVNNNGGWYDFGFVLGAGILFGGGSRAGK